MSTESEEQDWINRIKIFNQYIEFCSYVIEGLQTLQKVFTDLKQEMEILRANEANETEPVTTADYNPNQDR